MPDAHLVPTLPAVHARALAMLNDRNLDIRPLAELAETDPALTAALLRAANSAVSAPIRRVDTASDAVIRIGLEHTRRVIIASVVRDSFRTLEEARIDVPSLWRHLVATALIADATAWGGEHRSAAFTAGLLHDVGRMAMAQADPPRYARVALAARNGVDAVEAELRAFGYGHAEYGIEVAEAWAVPDEVAEAIGDHHVGEASPMAWAVANGRRIASALGIGDGLVAADAASGIGTLSEDERALLHALGGPDRFLERIDWLCGAVTSAPERLAG